MDLRDYIWYSAWRTLDGGSWHYTGDRDQNDPQGKEMQKSKMAVWGGLTNGLFIQMECKNRKSRNTWSNRQIWPWSIEWSSAKVNRVLPRECTGHSKHPLPTIILHMDITRWPLPKSDWLYSLPPKMEKLYTVSKNKTRSWLWLRSWTPYCQIQT